MGNRELLRLPCPDRHCEDGWIEGLDEGAVHADTVNPPTRFVPCRTCNGGELDSVGCRECNAAIEFADELGCWPCAERHGWYLCRSCALDPDVHLAVSGGRPVHCPTAAGLREAA